MRDTEGLPVLIDPAVYYGHREAELAMTKLFGGFDASFYQAYKEEWPLKPGYERREAVYTLYHVMNHLNLFWNGLSESLPAINAYCPSLIQRPSQSNRRGKVSL